jgi:hypothetical protein
VKKMPASRYLVDQAIDAMRVSDKLRDALEHTMVGDEYLALLREKRNQDKVVRNVLSQLRADPQSATTQKSAMVEASAAPSVADDFRAKMKEILDKRKEAVAEQPKAATGG